MVSLNNHGDQKHDCMITTAYTICYVHAGQGAMKCVDKNLEIKKRPSIVIIFARFHCTKPEGPFLLAS